MVRTMRAIPSPKTVTAPVEEDGTTDETKSRIFTFPLVNTRCNIIPVEMYVQREVANAAPKTPQPNPDP